MIENKFLDKLGGNINNTHLIGLDHLTEIKKEHNLIDIWRNTILLKEPLHFITIITPYIVDWTEFIFLKH